MRKLGSLALPLCATLLLAFAAGCGKQNCDDLIGTWKPEVKVPKADKNNPFAGMAEGFANAMASGVTLEFKPENRYEMTLLILHIEGTASRSGNTVTLTPEKIMGMTIEDYKKKQPQGSFRANDDGDKPVRLKVTDSDTLTAIPDGDEKGEMVFKRQKQQE